MTNWLKGLPVLQDTLLQLDHVLMLPLDALQGPELLQSQFHVFGHMAAHPFHSDFAPRLVNDGLVNHAVAPPAHFSHDAVLGFRSHPSFQPSKRQIRGKYLNSWQPVITCSKTLEEKGIKSLKLSQTKQFTNYQLQILPTGNDFIGICIRI